ncbi:rhodanese-like domain-containing protein [Thiomicrospira sp. WB1]|uniref:rhodanese-like domain-containing protein n=1 Tax=Thiomicrospira sp. WB1 TaxID=1685380 RepID=UPI00074972DE|nr:rhodanese-like domain-containing protein [Thiomicrospira sp. WB1]KUJ72954.1 sulfurtransferase [Thiomicrospira sp. WB1]
MFTPCDECKALIKNQNAYLVDVRTPPEFEAQRLPGAINLPLQTLQQTAEQALEKDRPVVVFCRSGSRSQMAMQMLNQMGYEAVYNMGPYQAWYQCED